MICPWCQSNNIYCKDSRPAGIGRRRRYACEACGGRFSTLEMPYLLEQEVKRRAFREKRPDRISEERHT